MATLNKNAPPRIERRPFVLAAALCSLVGVAAAADPPAWEIDDGARHIIVEGNRAFAVKTAIRLRAIEATSAWLLGWADTAVKPPPELVFELDPATLRRVFSQGPVVHDVGMQPPPPTGAAISLPSLSLIVAPRDPEHRLEYESLQTLYSSLLPGIDHRLTAWPPCVQQGVESLLAYALFDGSDRLIIDAERFAAGEIMNPEGGVVATTFVNRFGLSTPAEFLDPAARPDLHETGEHGRAFACLILMHWYVTSEPDQHTAFEQLFQSLATGRPLADSVPAALGGSLQEFTARYRSYAIRWRDQPHSFTVRRTLTVQPAPPADPVAVPADRLEALLRQTCLKLSRCRSP